MKRGEQPFLTFILCLLMLLFAATAGFAAPKTTLRVGWYPVDGLNDYDEATGSYHGYNYDYLKAIAQYTGWEYAFVVEPFDQCMADLTKGDLDLVCGLDKTPEREAQFAFTVDNTGSAAPRLVARADSTKYAFEDFAGWQGMKIGFIKGSIYEEEIDTYAAQHNFTYAPVAFANQQQMAEAFNTGKVDALFISGTRNIQNVRLLSKLPLRDLYFACNKNKAWIVTEVDKALNQIRFFDRNFDERVYTKYFSDSSIPSVAFSISEQKYLQNFFRTHASINVLYDPAWLPLEAKDSETGEFVGIVRDIYDLLAERTGLKFNFISADTYKAALEKYKNDANLFSIMAYSFNWAEMHNAYVTYPILDMQVFKISQGGTEGQEKIALTKKYYISQVVQERMLKQGEKPAYVFYDTVEECLEAVRNRKVNSTYINHYELNYYMDKLNLEHLNIQNVEGLTLQYGIGVNKNAGPVMLTIISRGLSSINSKEIEQLVMKRTQQRLQPSLTDFIYANPGRYLSIALGLLWLLGFMVYLFFSNRYNRKQTQLMQAASAAKSEFLSRVSHDIRTPINAIIHMTAFAKEDLKNKEKVEEELNKIENSSKHLLSLINDVLDISRAESNKIELHPEPYPFEEYMQGIRNIFEPICQKKGQKLVIKTSGCASVAIVDKVRFDQVTVNILSNAVKYTPAGGTIHYTSNSKTLPDNKIDCSFTIKDDGIGMSEAFQKAMFEPFSQEHNNPQRSKAVTGTGLGLSIVKRLVNIMGGTISVKSKRGEGTEVTVRYILPAATQQQLAQLKREQADSSLAQVNSAALHLQGRLLLAEDNAINAEIALRILQRFGLKVDIAVNGQEAVKKFAASQLGEYQAILMDIQMPIVNGYEAAQQIRKLTHPEAKTIPIIAMTADVFADAVEKSKACGMNEHIGKPVNVKELFAVLSRYLARG